MRSAEATYPRRLERLEFPNNAVPHAAGAYSNVITWASNSKEFRLNAEKVATDWQLYGVDIQDAEPLRVRDDLSYPTS
jgi:hypothetical protein